MARGNIKQLYIQLGISLDCSTGRPKDRGKKKKKYHWSSGWRVVQHTNANVGGERTRKRAPGPYTE